MKKKAGDNKMLDKTVLKFHSTHLLFLFADMNLRFIFIPLLHFFASLDRKKS